MRELDKTKCYELSDLTSEELKKVAEETRLTYKFIETHKETALLTFSWKWEMNANIKPEFIHNAKELFYTLENVQVDCRELSEDKIKEMADVFEKAGYETWNNIRALKKDTHTHLFLEIGIGNEVYLNYKKENKTTITYEKFMELFGRKEENFKKLVEVLNEELTEEAYKETEYEVKYIAEKPKQYQIGIDTFERCEANMTKEEILACVRFNIDKYNWRNKGQDLEDLEKIISYANWAIKHLKK